MSRQQNLIASLLQNPLKIFIDKLFSESHLSFFMLGSVCVQMGYQSLEIMARMDTNHGFL